MKALFNSILKPIFSFLKHIFYVEKKEIRGTVVILRIKKKFFSYNGEDDIVVREQPILVFKDNNHNFDVLPVNNENYKAIRSMNAKGQDMILQLKSHSLFGNYPTKLMVKPSFNDKFVEFTL